MKIETKLSLSEHVFVIHENEILQAIVTGVFVSVETIYTGDAKTGVRYDVSLSTGAQGVSKRAGEIFASAEDAIAHIKESIDNRFHELNKLDVPLLEVSI